MIDIQTKMKGLFGGSCYGYCLAYVFGEQEDKDIKYLTSCFLEGWKRGYIDDDGFVSKPLKYIEMLCGTKYKDVEKPSIHKIEDIKELTIVEYAYNNGSHFVVVKDGNVVFDPSGYSMSVKYGVPFTYRKFIK